MVWKDIEFATITNRGKFGGNGTGRGDSLLPGVRETGRHLVGGGVLDKTGSRVGR